MKAYHFVGSLVSEPDLIRKTSPALIRCILCIGLLSACHTKWEAKPRAATTVGVTTTAKQEKPQAIAAKSKAKVPPTQTAATTLDSELPAKPQTLSEQVGNRLSASFEVKTLDRGTLQIVKSAAGKSSASLFEEAIILGKLRAFLKSSALASMSSSVIFHTGVATVNLSREMTSGSASVLIAEMLSLDGVNEVRVIFTK